MDRKSKLKESLMKAMKLDTLSKSPEYVNSFLPYLKELATVSYIDPLRFKTEEEYLFQLKNANMRAGVYSEIISFLASQEIIMKKIREELEKPDKSYGV